MAIVSFEAYSLEHHPGAPNRPGTYSIFKSARPQLIFLTIRDDLIPSSWVEGAVPATQWIVHFAQWDTAAAMLRPTTFRLISNGVWRRNIHNVPFIEIENDGPRDTIRKHTITLSRLFQGPNHRGPAAYLFTVYCGSTEVGRYDTGKDLIMFARAHRQLFLPPEIAAFHDSPLHDLPPHGSEHSSLTILIAVFGASRRLVSMSGL
ncbi:hypothetical protein C8F01DRAFT_1363339 [Mycena amicta]|nr:hypothetical protein C8F01DRAFT_1363339 [Mycena amicta]